MLHDPLELASQHTPECVPASGGGNPVAGPGGHLLMVETLKLGRVVVVVVGLGRLPLGLLTLLGGERAPLVAHHRAPPVAARRRGRVGTGMPFMLSAHSWGALMSGGAG